MKKQIITVELPPNRDAANDARRLELERRLDKLIKWAITNLQGDKFNDFIAIACNR